MFENRFEAARLLVTKLEKFRYSNALILSIPKGGIQLGYTVAQLLDLPLEIALVKNLEHPFIPDKTIGTVTLNTLILNHRFGEISTAYLERETKRIKQVLKDLYRFYMGKHVPLDLRNKKVIIVDEGMTSGKTMRSIVDSIRMEQAEEIIIAVPVAPECVVLELSRFVDEVICLETPKDFIAVGQFYADFHRVKDEEVLNLLADANHEKRVAC